MILSIVKYAALKYSMGVLYSEVTSISGNFGVTTGWTVDSLIDEADASIIRLEPNVNIIMAWSCHRSDL